MVLGIQIIDSPDLTQFQQLYRQLRDRIVDGALAPDQKLPSTRVLADELKLARSLVVEVIDQLKAEGFVEGRHGSGTYVLPLDRPADGRSRTGPARFRSPAPRRQPPSMGEPARPLSLIAGKPDFEAFPRQAWNQCYSAVVTYSDNETLGYPPPLGHRSLRQEISAYLFRMKGIAAAPEQIVVTAGTSQALAILAQLPGRDAAVLEDPVATFVRDIFDAHGCSMTTARVDAEGIVPDAVSVPEEGYLYVSPSHQFPLGGTLSARRRLALIGIAEKCGSYIVEDDYDGEYRHDLRPIAPMQVLAPERVIYLGSFSKIFSPALRIGYMVVPAELMPAVSRVKSRWDLFTDGISQLAMARFIKEGYLDRHLRKMIRFYRTRRNELVQIIHDRLGPEWEISGASTGVHLIIRRPGCRFTPEFENRAAQAGLEIETVASYCTHSYAHQDKLIVGYGNRSRNELERGIEILQECVAADRGGLR